MVLMEALDQQGKSWILILVKQTQNFAWVYIIAWIRYLFVNGKEIFKFKGNEKNVIFPTQFCLGSISNELSAIESREVSLNENVYGFTVNYNSLDKFNILNIYNIWWIRII